MDKSAQKRSRLSKLKEFTNLSGKSSELFDNDFKEIMSNLRKVDDNIRSIVIGEAVSDTVSVDLEKISLKELLNQAKRNINQREYTMAVSDLARFRKKVRQIQEIAQKFDGDVSGVHEKMQLSGLDEDTQKHLRELRQSFASMNKKADFLDIFRNMGTSRGRALRFWEKSYPNQVAKLKSETKGILSASINLFDYILSSLKKLEDFRATRKVDMYVSELGSLIKSVGSFDAIFKKYYESNIKGFLEKLPQPKEEPPVTSQSPSPTTVSKVSPTVPAGTNIQNTPSDFFNKRNISTEQVTLDGPVSLAPVKIDTPTFELVEPTVQRRPSNTALEEKVPQAVEAPATPVATVVPKPGAKKPNPQVATSKSKPAEAAKPEVPKAVEAPKPEVPKAKGPRPPVGLEELGFYADDGFSTHAEFYNLLNKIAQSGNTKQMSSFISKYAKSIASSDVSTSLKLFNVIKSIGE